MEKIMIKSPGGIPLGTIETGIDGRQVVKTMGGISLATYDKEWNMTRDMQGIMIARGNVLPSFLWAKQ